MGYDTDVLKIISMNVSGRNGRQHLDFRQSYLPNIVGEEKPDILFLPGDDPKTLTQLNYQQVLEPTQNETVLLYDATRLKLQPRPMPFDFVIPGLDFGKVVSPMVSITAPAPARSIVKEFICVSWHWQLSISGGSKVRYQSGQQLMRFSQLLSWFTGKEVLIGGDFNLPQDKIRELLKEHNNEVQQGIESLKPFFREMGYMDCMTESINEPQRRLRQLRLHKCREVENQTENNYFIASKEMQLFQTKNVCMESLSYRSTSLSVKKKVPEYRPTLTKCPEITRNPAPSTSAGIREYCPAPTTTHMYIPPRPPKHNGG